MPVSREEKMATKKFLWDKITELCEKSQDIQATMEREIAEELLAFRSSIKGLANQRSRGLVLKTPKARRKRIETIVEDEVLSETGTEGSQEDPENPENVRLTRSRRGASIRAAASMKKQQAVTLSSKLRRPSEPEEATLQSVRSSRSKRPIDSMHGSDDEEFRRPAKVSKVDVKGARKKRGIKTDIKEEPMSVSDSSLSPDGELPPMEKTSQRQLRSKSSLKNTPVNNVTHTIINETVNIPDATVSEQSMYEDALKSIPMNSTMNPNTTVTIDRKMLNVTVVLEKLNDTTLTTRSTRSRKGSDRHSSREHSKNDLAPVRSVLESKNQLHQKMTSLKETLASPSFDELMTDDESSPEKSSKQLTKTDQMLRNSRGRNRPVSSDESDVDEILPSPVKPKKTLSKFKQNPLFSPYSKEPVKKRIEAFEQARGSPAPEEPSVRITRTKTRALASKDDRDKTPPLAVNAARKSLSKAKKISLAKQRRELDEEKENTTIMSSAQKPKSLLKQQRITPVSKSRLQMPMTVNRNHVTPAKAQIPSSKPVSSSRAQNRAPSADFGMKPLTKSSSTDSLAEKRNKMVNDEDARRKKEDALKAQTEERRRRREEKELKNRLAREAREKSEVEKRLRLEKDREEKARQAQLQQERLREEIEKKRLAQLQRAQEKEEKRRQEEQMKIARLQEQDETERALAKERLREQNEAERRRIAEIRAQKLAAEAARLKQQYQAKAKMLEHQKQPQQQPMSYKLDSEPDDEDSDDELNPKHTIPLWARPHVRQPQLEMQQYIPMSTIMAFFDTRVSTPDLSELFIGIRKDRLQRTSSANWKDRLPRFSMMED